MLGDRAREQFAQKREAALAHTVATPDPSVGARKSPEEIRRQAIEEWRAIRAQLGRDGSGAAAAPEHTAIPAASSRPLDVERQIGSLRRELGRDDFAL